MKASLWLTLLGLSALLPPAVGADSGSLRAGAAKVEITPGPTLAAARYDHEHLYIRAIVLDNGVTRAALIGVDQGNMPEEVWQDAGKKIAAELNCPVDNIIMSATHTHSGAGRGPNGEQAEVNAAQLSASMLEAVRQAKAKLQAARMGYGTGVAYLNVNRDALDPQTHLWTQAPNLQAASDKTVAVLKFQTPAGQPIAAYVNYAMHAINGYLAGFISSDFPGAMSHYIEAAYDERMIAVFTQGASGDQNPLYLRPSTNQMASESGVPITGDVLVRESVESRIRGTDLKPKPADPRVADHLKRWMDVEGAVLGEEVIRVMTDTTRISSEVRIWGSDKTVTCPGRKRTDSGREGMSGSYQDAGPVKIRLGVLGIGNVALDSVNAEIYTMIGQRTKKQSPLANTMIVTLADGRANSGYIPDDASFSHNTFQVLGSQLKPGCAESAIANGLTDLVSEYQRL